MLSYIYKKTSVFKSCQTRSLHCFQVDMNQCLEKKFLLLWKKWNHFKKILSCQDLWRSEFVILIVTKKFLYFSLTFHKICLCYICIKFSQVEFSFLVKACVIILGEIFLQKEFDNCCVLSVMVAQQKLLSYLSRISYVIKRFTLQLTWFLWH